MEIEKNIFTFIIYTIIITVIGAIAVIAVTQAINNNSTVSDLQTNIKSLETSFNTLSSDWNKEKSVLDKTNSDVVEQLNEIKNNWGKVIKSGDTMTLQYDGKWKDSKLNGGNVIKDPYRLMAPMNCEINETGQGKGAKWSSCNMGFSEGGGPGGGWSIHKY